MFIVLSIKFNLSHFFIIINDLSHRVIIKEKKENNKIIYTNTSVTIKPNFLKNKNI